MYFSNLWICKSCSMYILSVCPLHLADLSKPLWSCFFLQKIGEQLKLFLKVKYETKFMALPPPPPPPHSVAQYPRHENFYVAVDFPL